VTDDISVSRAHAIVHKGPSGEYFILDNQSKFGTLALIQYPIFVGAPNTHDPLHLQSGKTILSF
jgi:hypothetical protein